MASPTNPLKWTQTRRSGLDPRVLGLASPRTRESQLTALVLAELLRKVKNRTSRVAHHEKMLYAYMSWIMETIFWSNFANAQWFSLLIILMIFNIIWFSALKKYCVLLMWLRTCSDKGQNWPRSQNLDCLGPPLSWSCTSIFRGAICELCSWRAKSVIQPVGI